MQTHMVLCAIIADGPGALERLVETVSRQRCQVRDCRATIMGEWRAVILEVSGSWDRLALLEGALAQLATEEGVSRLHWERVRAEMARIPGLPYLVDAIGLVESDMVTQVLQFLAEHGIRLRDLSTQSYVPPHGTDAMIALRAQVDVPSSLHLGELKQHFFDLCDRLNLDAVLEPDRSA
ncbi:MAG: glycine cleavage system protein R [Halothiobacillaceae bacterium]